MKKDKIVAAIEVRELPYSHPLASLKVQLQSVSFRQ